MAVRRKKKRLRTRRIAAAVVCVALLLTAIGFGGAALIEKLFATPDAPPSNSSVPVIPPVSSDPVDPTVRPVSSVTISNTGDILFHGKVIKDGLLSDGSYNYDHMFAYLKPYVEKATYATANLEGTLPGKDYSGYPKFGAPDAVADALLGSGFDMLTTANNHTNDRGETGLLRTADVLAQKGFDFIGTRANTEDKNYLVKQMNGISVGMISYTYGAYRSDGRKSLNGLPCTSLASQLVNMFDYNKLDLFYTEMETAIANMKQDGAEVIVVYMHWGNEYRLTTTQTQRTMAQKLCDLGVDVIVGAHPHVVEPVDLLTSTVSGKNTLCVYSMGNAISNQRVEEPSITMKSGHTEDGMLFSFTVTKYSDGSVRLTDAAVLPTWVHLYSKTYQIIPLDKTVSDWSVFGLNQSRDGMERAKKSYDRTMAIVGEGLEKFQAFFAEQQRQLDEYNASLLAPAA